MTGLRKIQGGLYLVVDPAAGLDYLFNKIEQAIEGGIDVLQVWNNWTDVMEKQELLNAICSLAHSNGIPVLINEDWELLENSPLDGVHFDNIPTGIGAIREKINRPFLCGITCGNDLSRIRWAEENNIDYISFCSMFPSPSAGVCEIVNKDTVIQARRLTGKPIFLAGGISLNNVDELIETGLDGIAVISGIMKAADPAKTTMAFKEKLSTIKTINNETILNK